MDTETLKQAVCDLLIKQYDVEPDDAEEMIEESISDKPDFWNENAIPEDLAKLLVSDED